MEHLRLCELPTSIGVLTTINQKRPSVTRFSLHRARALAGVRVILAALVIVAVVGIVLASTQRTGTSTTFSRNQDDSSVLASSSTATLRRSGPVSTFPAAWNPWSSCPGEPDTGNITTVDGLSTVSYPGSWNTTKVVTLGQVYQDIIGSANFTDAASGHGWVVFSWDFIPGASTNIPVNSPDITAYFILTNSTSPIGYVYAYYDIRTGGVTMGPVDTFPYPAEYLCSSTASNPVAT